MSTILGAYALGVWFFFLGGLLIWGQAEGDQSRKGERRWGARTALLSWSWPVALPIAAVVGFVWLIRQLLSDALGH